MPESVINLLSKSDLQFALLIMGLVLITALLVYNLLRAKKIKKIDATAEEYSNLVPENESPSRVEPVLNTFIPESTSESDDRSSINLKDDHQDQPTANSPLDAPLPHVQQTAEPFISKIDPGIDMVAALKFSLLIKGLEIFEHFRNYRINFSRNVALEGLRELTLEDQVTSNWESIDPEHEYREIHLSIQIADRRGPLRNDELSEFMGMVQNLAQELDAEVDMPPATEVIQDAEDLDQFAVQSDIQLSFSLKPNMISWVTKDVENSLMKNGLMLSRDGFSFNYLEQGVVLFKAQIPSLNFLTDDLLNSRVKQIIFNLDVPLVEEHFQPFMKMHRCAVEIAQELDGKLFDDNGQILDPSLAANIQNYLDPIYSLMHERQISPGSPTALRLFS